MCVFSLWYCIIGLKNFNMRVCRKSGSQICAAAVPRFPRGFRAGLFFFWGGMAVLSQWSCYDWPKTKVINYDQLQSLTKNQKSLTQKQLETCRSRREHVFFWVLFRNRIIAFLAHLLKLPIVSFPGNLWGSSRHGVSRFSTENGFVSGANDLELFGFIWIYMDLLSLRGESYPDN